MKCTVQCVFTTVYTNNKHHSNQVAEHFLPPKGPTCILVSLQECTVILTRMGFNSFFLLILTKCPDNAQYHLDL